MDGDNCANERELISLSTAHLFEQLAEGKHSTHTDAHGGAVKMAFLQENEMVLDGEVGKERGGMHSCQRGHGATAELQTGSG